MTHSDFDALYKEHDGKVRRTVRRLAADNLDDVMQDTWLRVWLHYDTFKHQAKTRTWITRIALNVAVMALRTTRGKAVAGPRSFIALDVEVLDRFHNCNGGYAAVDARHDLNRVLALLPLHEREALHNRYALEETPLETSRRCGDHIGSLKSKQYRALKLARRIMEEK